MIPVAEMGALNYVMLWVSYHRIAVIFCLGVSLWVIGFGRYFRPIVKGELRLGKPHKWSVDLATKQRRRGKDLEIQ